MYKKSFQSILFMLILFVFTSDMFPCTSILVTKGASEKGAPMISYSCDGEFHPHLRITPAAKYKSGEMVEIRGWRGVLGKIPQVPETYKVIGLMNEFQLAIGETTFGGRKELISNKGIFHYYPLMRIALQRAKTAREAIIVMTTLVEKHGYRSEGESISIADKHEAWLLEIVGPGKDGIGAIWVAIKIPDGMVSATANMSRIHEFPLNDPGNVLYSENVISFAVKHGYYDPEKDGNFSFSKAYNPPTEEQIRYSSRRIWSIFRRISPSMNISSKYSNGNTNLKPYELYIKPDSKLNVRDVIALHRDHYENTKFDMTKDLVSGPFEAPDRWRPMKWKSGGKLYAWERPIATQQAGFVFVSESRAYVPDDIGGIVWFGMDNPYTNVFVPVYTSVTELPLSYTIGSLKKYTRDSAWWT
ncbi:MAG: C69 family dipeptidase, partial [Candidatus Aminicenantes bacterium]|nr:C69 family dipeptidase [Candidatus Aminicenantes bacterium]